MSRRIHLRELSDDELIEIRQMALQTENPLRARRAQLLIALIENPKLSPTSAAIEIGYKNTTCALMWVKRFNEDGIKSIKRKKKRNTQAR